jgi:hypothetical protein
MDEWESYPLDEDKEYLRHIVGNYFSIYDAKEGENAFYINIPQDNTLEEKFESLRLELKDMGFIPLLRYEGGEYILHILKKPKLNTRPEWINIVLFFTTLITTMLSGSILFLTQWSIKDMLMPENLLNGLIFFSFPLMAILGIHELGHYFVSKKHNVAASLPFFIPIPPNPVLPLGTLGAVISMREPIPDRKALIDIGIAGPIAGFLVSIPVCIIGLFLMQQKPVIATDVTEGMTIHFPLLLTALSQFFTIPSNSVIHPTAFAGWVGLLVTAINLLPAGQLDGGHIARGALREKHKYASFAAIGLLVLSSFFGGGWLFMAFFIVFFIGAGHPPALNEFVPLDGKRKVLVLLSIVIFVLSFTPIPIS